MSLIKDSCGKICMKKVTTLACLVTAIVLAFVMPDFSMVALFLGTATGTNTLTAIREIRSDKNKEG